MLTLVAVQHFVEQRVSSLEFPEYAACHDAMRRCHLTFSPSEAHAIAAGLFAGNVDNPEAHWAAAVYADLEADDALAQECRQYLEALYRATFAQLQDLTFGLQLFLPASPDPDYPVGMALRDWAQGFLYGFGLAGDAAATAHLSQEGREALQDFYEIGNLDVSADALDEEEEQAAAEIEEYLRVAAMLIHEDMHVRQPTGEVSDEIH